MIFLFSLAGLKYKVSDSNFEQYPNDWHGQKERKVELPPEAPDESPLMKRNEWEVLRPLLTYRQLPSVPLYKWISQSQQLGRAEHLDKGLTWKSFRSAAGQYADLAMREHWIIFHFYHIIFRFTYLWTKWLCACSKCGTECLFVM